MTDEKLDSPPAALLKTLPLKSKQPASVKVLNAWIAQAEGRLGDEAKGGRLGWLIASTVAIAAVQQAVGADGRQLFLLKGGTLLQHRLNETARTTKDVDGLVRGDLNAFFAVLEDTLDRPWGPLTLRRGEVGVIDVPTKIIRPRRFDIILELRGVTWRRIPFEVSPDEAGIGDEHETIEPPPLGGFGLPDAEPLVGISMRFQIAQKLHAVSDPHEPPDSINDRARDVVDLLLLRGLIEATGSPTLAEVRQAGVAVFEARAAEAAELGRPPRAWPPTIIAHDHWAADYANSSNVRQRRPEPRRGHCGVERLDRLHCGQQIVPARMSTTTPLAKSTDTIFVRQAATASTSSPRERCFDGGDVDLLHLHHRLEGTFRGGPVGVDDRVEQHPRGDLPRHAPLVLAPATGALAAVVVDDRVPQTVGLGLVVGGDLKRERLGVGERGPAVQADAGDATHREVHGQDVALPPGRVVARRAHDRTDLAVGKRLGVELRRIEGRAVEPQADRVLAGHRMFPIIGERGRSQALTDLPPRNHCLILFGRLRAELAHGPSASVPTSNT